MCSKNEFKHIVLRNVNAEPLAGHLNLGGQRPDGLKIDVNSLYFTLNGKPFIPVMGEFHYSRYPDELWEDEILKMKAGGINVISTYIFWIHHEEEEGKFDWTGRRNLRKFLELCARHELYTFIRIGPWCHGEVRNGGFPDWILNKCKLRCDDKDYLTYVARLFKEISRQVEGLLFKSGGNIMGVQLENELRSGPEHLITLKKMAIELGIDAPIFTATGWAGDQPGASWIPRDEMIPVFAGYPDGAWDQRLTDISSEWLYFFHHVRNDFFIGNDLFGYKPDASICDCEDIKRYPYATCELGAGMNNSYHRRPVITADDVCSLVSVKLGNGNNLPGYYVYHGGSNPEGKLSTLQESKETGYPNDYTVISYDYQAPIGEFGQIRQSYGQLNLIHMFLNDFGGELAPMTSVLPEVSPAGTDDTETLRYAARTRNGKGFIFVNNYQRQTLMKNHDNVIFCIEMDEEELIFPRRGLSIRNNSYFILPFNMEMDGVLLKYSTAQLLCKIKNDNESFYFFFKPDGINTEYAFDAGTISGINVCKGSIEETGGCIYVNDLAAGTDCVINIKTTKSHHMKIITLTKKQAESCRKAGFNGVVHLFLTDANLIITKDIIRLFSNYMYESGFSVFPATGNASVKGGSRISGMENGVFTCYKIKAPVKEYKISYETSMKHEVLQCVIHIEAKDMDELNELYLHIDYVGDVAQAYINGRLITDEFYKGTKWEIGLKRYANELAKSPLTLFISALFKDAPIYIENRPEFNGTDKIVDIRSIKLIPEYKMDIVFDR